MSTDLLTLIPPRGIPDQVVDPLEGVMEKELDLPTHLLTEHRHCFSQAAGDDEILEALADESELELARRHGGLHLVKPRCSHCEDRPSRRSNGLCDACHSYRYKYGRLPDEDTLIRRAENKNR